MPNPYGPVPFGLAVEPGTDSLDALIGSTGRGLLVTHFHYTNLVDPMDLSVTGMTRDGLFRIEKGEIVGAARNLRFTDSILRAFSEVSGVTRERREVPGFFGGSFVSPGMRIEGFNFTSPTEF